MDPTAQQPAISVYPEWQEKHAKDADFILITSDNFEFSIKKEMLAANSNKFADLFADPNMSLMGDEKAKIQDVTGDVMIELLMFIYERHTTQNFPTVVGQVYYAANNYSLAGLKEICVEQLANQMSVDSICVGVEIAKKFGLNQLYNRSLKFIVAQRQDPQLPWDQLAQLGDGKLLKELVLLTADDTYVAQL